MVASTQAHKERERRARLFVAALLATAVGCSEVTEPTRTLVPETAALAAGGNQRVKVKTFQLSANTLRIDGPVVTGQASISNSGLAIPSDVSIQGLIQQGTVTRQAALAPIVCAGSPGDVGKLPTGNCDVSMTAQASNSGVGDGILAPGAATFVLRVIDGTATELASKSVAVNLVGSPTLGTPGVVSFAWAIDGPATSYTITLKNPASDMQGVFLRSTVVQGASRRSAAADLQVSCGGGAGVFPAGVCTMTVPAAASSGAVGVGPLVPGPALIEVQLNQSGGGTITTFDTETAAIELVSSTPKIANVTLQSTTLVIGGASVDYTAELQNAGFQVTDVILQGEMEQDQGGGTVVKGAGGTYVQCGALLGVLPTGTCNVPFTVTATGDGNGGSFVPGPARFVLHLYKAPANQVPVEYDQRIIDVTLVSGTPSIVSITPASSFVELDKEGAFTNIAVILANPGASLSTVIIQGWIRQGAARRAAGGTVVTCGPIFGALPNGGCTQASVIVADNTQSSGTGTLVPGDATFELELKHNDGTVETILDMESIPITLVANGPSILSVALESSTLVIGGALRPATATVYNPTGATLSGVSIQGWIDQGSATQPSGGTAVSCAGTGELPPGTCLVRFTLVVQNQFTPFLVEGPATLRLELRQNPTVLDTKLVPITLINP